MRVFAEIAQDTRRQIIESRAQQIEARTGHNPFPNGLPPSRTQTQRNRNEMGEPTWDPEGEEKAREADRERDLSTDLSRIEQDGGFANQPGRNHDESRGKREGGRQEITRATRGTWDKIRQSTFGAGQGQNADPAITNGIGQAAVVTESERTKEQREFDAMLEKERQGATGDDKWA